LSLKNVLFLLGTLLAVYHGSLRFAFYSGLLQSKTQISPKATCHLFF